MRVNPGPCALSLVLCSLVIGCGDSSKSNEGAAIGGTANAGGGEATGGSGSDATGGTGPGAVSAKCSNLPPARGGGGIAKPTGTAGNLRVVDWAGYTGAVSFTFDDQSESQMAAYPTLNALGVKYTFYVVSGWGLTKPNLVQAAKDGHEIGNHTSTHSQSTITDTAIDDCTSEIQAKLGVTPYTFAAPYGTNGSAGWEQYAKSRFIIDRGITNGLMKPNDSINQWNLLCYIPPEEASASTMQQQILAAQTGGGWKVVLVHGFTTHSDGAWQPVAVPEFTATVEYAKSLGDLWIDTVRNIGSYWVGQKLVTKATPTTTGSDTVYSWEWPDFYPPESCVRVTVDGGTLLQNGAPLQWDEHGYYEVSLNAGSLTLSP